MGMMLARTASSSASPVVWKAPLYSAGLVLAVLLAACSPHAVSILPEGQIQLQNGTRQISEVSEASGQLTLSADLPAIRPGSPDFHASRVEDFELASGDVQLVEFFAYWCAVCKAVAPTIHGLENMYGHQVNFVYLDRDDPQTLRAQELLGYTYQPHFFLIGPEGQVLGQWRGYVDGQELQRALLDSLAQ